MHWPHLVMFHNSKVLPEVQTDRTGWWSHFVQVTNSGPGVETNFPTTTKIVVE